MFFRIFRRLRRVGKDLVVGFYAFRHASTPVIGKWLLITIAVYLLSPFDLIPDTFPVLGWLDDFALASLVLPQLLNSLPADVLHNSRQRTDSLWIKVFRSDKI